MLATTTTKTDTDTNKLANHTHASHIPDIHNQTLALVKQERLLTGLIIANLQKIQDQNLHLKMGYSTLFEYCTKALGYAEPCAYRRISAIKVARQIPEVTAQLDAGTLSLTSVAMAQSFFASANKNNSPLPTETKKQILKSLEFCSKRESEEVLIKAANKLGLQSTGLEITEKIRPLSMEESVLQVRLKTTTLEKLNRLKNLRAHKNPNMSYSDLIEDLCTFALKKLDPMEPTVAETKKTNEMIRPTDQKANAKSYATKISSHNPRYIPPNIRRAVWRRDQGRCTYVADAPENLDNVENFAPKRCRSNHLLQIDHIQPLSLGGETVQQNLRLLCHAHHKLRETEF
jgi:hypothetical protein